MRKVEEEKARIQRIKRDNSQTRASKFYTKMVKNEIKYKSKTIKDIEFLKQTISEIKENDNIYLFSNLFDAPNIVMYFLKYHKIDEIFVSTWAITDKGLETLKQLNDANIKVRLLLDATYSYKWVFTSGAIDYLKNVEFKFTANHSKMILVKTDSLYITVLGSMNFTNNPRFENVNIIENKDIYTFFSNELNLFFDGKKSETYQQGNLFESTTEFTKAN